jgi:hypothetical protein
MIVGEGFGSSTGENLMLVEGELRSIAGENLMIVEGERGSGTGAYFRIIAGELMSVLGAHMDMQVGRVHVDRAGVGIPGVSTVVVVPSWLLVQPPHLLLLLLGLTASSEMAVFEARNGSIS